MSATTSASTRTARSRTSSRSGADRRSGRAGCRYLIGTTHDRRDLVGQPGAAHGTLPHNDPLWFKRAVFYEVLVRGFADSNGDGTGDLRGLTDKLDYLQWLGVDCLWLPPFYPRRCATAATTSATTPACCPEFGTVEDFQTFLDAAHDRGIRVIIDFVMNHTSDAHPWFQAAAPTRDGPYGDFYVWGDDDTRYPDARIIFVDTEPSNWTFDPVRKQYFWHRFFSHQPDLNFDNPAVQDAIARRAAVLARPGHRRVPAGRRALPVRAGGHQRREPAGDPRVPQADPQGGRQRLPRPGAAVRGQPVAGRRGRVLRRPVGRRRRVPHGLPLPGDAAHLHGRAPRERGTRSRRSWRRPRRSRTTASGASSCATTTS